MRADDAGSVMCEKCEATDAKIAYYKRPMANIRETGDFYLRVDRDHD